MIYVKLLTNQQSTINNWMLVVSNALTLNMCLKIIHSFWLKVLNLSKDIQKRYNKSKSFNNNTVKTFNIALFTYILSIITLCEATTNIQHVKGNELTSSISISSTSLNYFYHLSIHHQHYFSSRPPNFPTDDT